MCVVTMWADVTKGLRKERDLKPIASQKINAHIQVPDQVQYLGFQ